MIHEILTDLIFLMSQYNTSVRVQMCCPCVSKSVRVVITKLINLKLTFSTMMKKSSVNRNDVMGLKFNCNKKHKSIILPL